MTSDAVRTFRARADGTASGGAVIDLPFDPPKAWGARPRYHVTGIADGICFRTTLAQRRGAWRMAFGPKSSACRLAGREAVDVEVWLEGPQADDLAPDIAEALASRPAALAAFSGLATFYRKGWLRWIDATKRRPEARSARIAEMLDLLEAGQKQNR